MSFFPQRFLLISIIYTHASSFERSSSTVESPISFYSCASTTLELSWLSYDGQNRFPIELRKVLFIGYWVCIELIIY